MHPTPWFGQSCAKSEWVRVGLGSSQTVTGSFEPVIETAEIAKSLVNRRILWPLTGNTSRNDSYRIECRLPDRISDELLLERAGTGESAAFLQLYERHRDPVFRFAYRLSGSVEAAEDITHDCFLGLLKMPANFKPGRATLRTYLLSAARNVWFKQLRTLDREIELDGIVEPRFEAIGRGPLTEILDDELTARVKQAVSDLPPMQREALVLFEYEGLTLNEIAEIVGVDVGAIKARLHRARQGLKSSLSTYLNSNREIVTLEGLK